MLMCGLVLIYETVMLICKNCLSCKAVLYNLLVFGLLIDGLSTTVQTGGLERPESASVTDSSLGILERREMSQSGLPMKMSHRMEKSSPKNWPEVSKCTLQGKNHCEIALF